MVNVENISYTYPRTTREILSKVGFTLEPSQCIAILGNNGAGKSTLLKCIDRVIPTRAGAVYVDGENVFTMSGGKMAQNLAYVPQITESVDMTVFDTVLLGRKPYIKWDATSADKKIVSSVIHELELDDYILRNVSELSGGEAQKVMLARALAQEPRLLLLDEPTSNLDPHNQHEVLRTIRRIAKQHEICVVIIIHDLNLAIRYCDRFLFLRDSQVYAYGGHEVMTPQNIEDVYKMHVHIINYMGIPVIVPFPDEVPHVHPHEGDEHG